MGKIDFPLKKMRQWLWLAPILVFSLTYSGIEWSVGKYPVHRAWIPSFVFYYLSIVLTVILSMRLLKVEWRELSFRLRPFPKFKRLLFLILIPGLLPLPVFILHVGKIPPIFFLYIILFSLINSIFEEVFWRGMIFHLPVKKIHSTLISATLFSFSHYLFWGAYWFTQPYVLFPTLISTFIMGYLWMEFVHREKNLLYPILSHALVDFFNLSVAAYCGLFF
jgi:membrane protease YdiL (CAAX protease family)